VFSEAIAHPPSPAEARVVGERIDKVFATISQGDNEYVEAITKLDWGKVYDPMALNDRKNVEKLIEVNRKALALSQTSFDRRDRAFADGLKDLQAMAGQSAFAKAMLFEFETRFKQPETGFADLSKELRQVTTAKHESLERKLRLLLGAPKDYKFLDAGNVAFQQTPKGKELMEAYQANMMEHNSMTARQRSIAELFVRNQQAVVERYRELSKA